MKYCLPHPNFPTTLRSTLRSSSAIVVGLSLVVMALLALSPAILQADGPDTAHIIVQFDEGHAIVRPISFTAPISGFAALHLTGLNTVVTTTQFGPGVCAIEGVGGSASTCFDTGFWSYSLWNGTAWEAYPVGSGDSVLNDGAIELWAWSPNFVSPPAPGSGPQFVSAAKALDWLAVQQSVADGGYGNKSNSLEVLMAIGANGYQAATWQRGADGPSLLSYVLGHGADYSTNGIAAAGKLAISLSAGEGCYPHGSWQPTDFLMTGSAIFTGGFGVGGAGAQSWGILGTRALSQSVPTAVVDYLKSIINADGGWGWSLGDSDTNGTALAIQALVASGESISSSEVVSGLAYLKMTQNSDGGFPYDPASTISTASDTNSTSYAIQAIQAAGQDPLTGTWRISSTHPISYLLGMQLTDGSFQWQPDTGPNQIATRQAIVALLGHTFPIQIKDVAACQTEFLPIIVKE